MRIIRKNENNGRLPLDPQLLPPEPRWRLHLLLAAIVVATVALCAVTLELCHGVL